MIEMGVLKRQNFYCIWPLAAYLSIGLRKTRERSFAAGQKSNLSQWLTSLFTVSCFYETTCLGKYVAFSAKADHMGG